MHFSMNVKYDGANIKTCNTFQTSPNIIKF